MTRTAADVEKLVRDLEYRVREVEILNGHVRELTAALETRGREIEALNRSVAELEDALKRRAAEVERLNQDVARLRGDVAARAQEVASLARALDLRAGETDDMEQAAARGPAAASVVVPEPRASAASAQLTRIPRRLDLPGLVWTIVRTDLKVRYHGTVGGLLWALLKPLATLAVLLTVCRWLFASAPDYGFKLVIGIVLWEFFAEGTKVGLLSLAAKGHLVGKALFPRWILVATSLANPLVPLSIFSVALVAALAATGRPPTLVTAAAFLWCVFQLAVVVLGFSLATSVLFVRYRDLNQFWEVAVQAGFFLAPIVYPMELVPVPLRDWLQLWPPTAAIEYARAVLLGRRLPSLDTHLLLAGLAAGSMVLGVVTFRRHEPTVAEHV